MGCGSPPRRPVRVRPPAAGLGLLKTDSDPALPHLAVLGAGAWGTAFAVLATRRYRVRLWGRNGQHVRDSAARRENARYLPGVTLPDALRLTADLAEALDGAVAVVSAVPAPALVETLAACSAHAGRLPLLWLSKGFVGHGDSEVRLPHQAVADLWRGTAAVLSGPSFAVEVARGLPTAVTVAARDLATAEDFADRFRFDTFRTYASDDLVGVEVGGAVKNVLAIASGIADGLAFGHNARAALITRGLAETGRLSEALGGRRDTLMGLSGLGDIVLTCTGDLSRNRQVGLQLAKGKPLARVLNELGHVAEGVETARRLRELTLAIGAEMPIATAVHQVLFEGQSPLAAVDELLRREPRAERH